MLGHSSERAKSLNHELKKYLKFTWSSHWEKTVSDWNVDWNPWPSFPMSALTTRSHSPASNELLKHANRTIILHIASSVHLNLETWVSVFLPISLPVCVSAATDGLVLALPSYWKKMLKHFTAGLSVPTKHWQKKGFTDRKKGKIIPGLITRWWQSHFYFV